jgi:hypothetical protein
LVHKKSKQEIAEMGDPSGTLMYISSTHDRVDMFRLSPAYDVQSATFVCSEYFKDLRDIEPTAPKEPDEDFQPSVVFNTNPLADDYEKTLAYE